MTSQQDTELAHILDDFAEELEVIRATAREDYYYETHGMSDDIDEAYEKATQALTSWKDKEVKKALDACDLKWAKSLDEALPGKAIATKIVESLQSQGGKNE